MFGKIEKEKDVNAQECMAGACRESARGVLERARKQQTDKAEALTVLQNVIPWQLLSRHDEEVLWNFFCGLQF